MVYVEAYEDFEKAAERVYLNAPMKCVQYKTDSQQELKKLEKLISNLMKHMASGER
ncbi:Signal recognition particle 9 kDa protein-like [Homarus americanus]|uniref:Signal recognition particle 9 kDa protein n=1 Tax=Homarus americanus TaxID=6706 RepID=A0A8J5K4Z8_HOMAM|nr:Signal recognition particle 9 kDa protein-like [Homarus americanus]